MREQPYASGSIDRSLLDAQVSLTTETRPLLYGDRPAAPPMGVNRPELERVVRDTAAAGSPPQARILALTTWCSRIPRAYPDPLHSTAAGYYGDFRSFTWGGSEEAVIAKGSPWPQEIARVLAALLQLVGMPARLVFLYRENPALLHTVVEVWVQDGWAVCDPCANRCYIWPHHGYASALALQQQPKLVDQTPEHGHNPYVDSSLYGTIAIAPYFLAAEPAADSGLRPARPEDLEMLRAAASVFKGV